MSDTRRTASTEFDGEVSLDDFTAISDQRNREAKFLKKVTKLFSSARYYYGFEFQAIRQSSTINDLCEWYWWMVHSKKVKPRDRRRVIWLRKYYRIARPDVTVSKK